MTLLNTLFRLQARMNGQETSMSTPAKDRDDPIFLIGKLPLKASEVVQTHLLAKLVYPGAWSVYWHESIWTAYHDVDYAGSPPYYSGPRAKVTLPLLEKVSEEWARRILSEWTRTANPRQAFSAFLGRRERSPYLDVLVQTIGISSPRDPGAGPA